MLLRFRKKKKTLTRKSGYHFSVPLSSTAFAFNLYVFFPLFIRHIFLLFRFQVINLNTVIVLLREQQTIVLQVRVQ